MKLNVFALIGALAVLLTVTVALTFTRATRIANEIGTLKCYEIGRPIEKPCDQPPRIVNISERDARSD